MASCGYNCFQAWETQWNCGWGQKWDFKLAPKWPSCRVAPQSWVALDYPSELGWAWQYMFPLKICVNALANPIYLVGNGWLLGRKNIFGGFSILSLAAVLHHLQISDDLALENSEIFQPWPSAWEANSLSQDHCIHYILINWPEPMPWKSGAFPSGQIKLSQVESVIGAPKTFPVSSDAISIRSGGIWHILKHLEAGVILQYTTIVMRRIISHTPIVI